MPSKIASIHTDILIIPLAEVTTNHPFLGQRSRHCTMVLRLRTSDGIEGFSHIATESDKQIKAIAEVVQGLGERIVGMDPLRRSEINDRIWRLTSELMHEGLSTMVQCVFDVALWDIFGKAANMPVSDLLGARRNAVPVYGSHGLHRNADLAKIEKDGARLVAEGFRAVKLRLLGRSIKEDVERARVSREVLGPDVEILSDALWSMSSATAVRLSQELAPYRLTWLEDPIHEDDYPGLARIRAAEGVPVASGERVTKLSQLQALLDAEAIDHLIIDLRHIGGITNWLKCVPLAELRNLPISGHGAYELQLPLLASLRDCGYLEYFPNYNEFYLDPPRLVDGMIPVSTRPGMGLELNEEFVRRFAV